MPRRKFPPVWRSAFVRCNHRAAPGKPACDARRTLAKPLGEYVRPPPCRVCGAREYRIDGDRTRLRMSPPRPCNCGQYPFPHRPGSLWCDLNRAAWPDGERDARRTGWHSVTPR